MCGHHHRSCLGCSHQLNRRGFLQVAGAAVADGLLATGAGAADDGPAPKARVALVFLSNSAEHEIWPYPGYDCAARHQEIVKALKQGCPQVEFLPVVVPHPADVQKAIALKDTVDGYLVYTVTLNWGLTPCLHQIGKLQKPMLVADEYLGGSGVFLVGLSGMARQGLAAGAVSTTRIDDLVAVARLFADVKKPGTTPASFAKQCEEAYRRTFAAGGDMKCIEDKVPLTPIGECIRRLKESKFLIVGPGPAGQQREFLGAKAIYIGFDEFKTVYEKTDRDEGAEWGRRWSARAEKVVEPTAE